MAFNKTQLKKLMVRDGMNIQTLSYQTELNASIIHRALVGKTQNPTFSTVEKFAVFFNVPMETFRTIS